MLTPGTVTGAGTVGTVQSVGRLTTTDGVASGTVKVVGGLAYRIVADSATITNTATETAFSNGAYTIPAATLKVGSQVRGRIHCAVPSGNAAETLTLRARLGAAGVAAQVVTATAAVDVTDGGGDIGVMDFVITVRTIGGGGTMVGNSLWVLGVQDTATTRADAMDSAAIDTTVARDLTITAQWSGASAANQVILRNMEVWID